MALAVFVCGSGETGNEIMPRAPTVSEQGLSKSGPGHRENTNHLLGSLAGLMEISDGSSSAVY